MHCAYDDIRGRIREEPKWWDERMVPRYCDFSPEKVADVYAEEAALVLIACQSCGYEFKVAFSHSSLSAMARHLGPGRTHFHPSEWFKVPARTLARDIEEKTIGCGDPPNIGCCMAGPTMSSNVVGVLEYWRRRRKTMEWARDTSLETELA